MYGCLFLKVPWERTAKKEALWINLHSTANFPSRSMTRSFGSQEAWQAKTRSIEKVSCWQFLQSLLTSEAFGKIATTESCPLVKSSCSLSCVLKYIPGSALNLLGVWHRMVFWLFFGFLAKASTTICWAFISIVVIVTCSYQKLSTTIASRLNKCQATKGRKSQLSHNSKTGARQWKPGVWPSCQQLSTKQ